MAHWDGPWFSSALTGKLGGGQLAGHRLDCLAGGRTKVGHEVPPMVHWPRWPMSSICTHDTAPGGGAGVGRGQSGSSPPPGTPLPLPCMSPTGEPRSWLKAAACPAVTNRIMELGAWPGPRTTGHPGGHSRASALAPGKGKAQHGHPQAQPCAACVKETAHASPASQPALHSICTV